MRFEQNREERDRLRSTSFATHQRAVNQAARRKLYVLFVLLLLVIYLMNEAGKPERWEWMGFKEVDRGGQSQSQNDAPPESVNSPATTIQIHKPTPKDAANSGPVTPKTASNENANNENYSSLFQELTDSKAESPEPYPFWSAALERLSTKRVSQFFELLRRIAAGSSDSDEASTESTRLVAILSRMRDDYHQALFDKLTLAPEGTPERTELAEQLRRSTDSWEKKIQPALESAAKGNDFTIGQQSAIISLRSLLDEFVLNEVKDKTSLGWSGDSLAWIRLWEKANGSPQNAPLKITRIELLGQPEFYRGKSVSFQGTVQAAKREDLSPTSQLAMPHYYSLWLKPEKSNLGPYNVVVRDIPGPFGVVESEFKDLSHVVSVTGYFFKIRSYVAADRTVAHCPVIIASSFKIIPVSQSVQTQPWQPSQGFLTTALTAIPVLAIALAWIAFRSTLTTRRPPGKLAATRIENTLSSLKDNPEIKSDLERVMTLYDQELEPKNEA